MTAAEFTNLIVLLDNVWGGVDEGREAGYRLLLCDEDYELVAEVVGVLAREDRVWLPKGPEIAARVDRLKRQRANDRRIRARLAQINHELTAGDQPQPALPQEATA